MSRTWQVMLAVAMVCAVLIGLLAFTRVRHNRTAGELLQHAPVDAQVYAFLDVELLRRTGVLERLAGARGVEEADYQRFVTQSGFDYRQHLDGVVMAKRGTAQYAVIAGTFDAARLRAYALSSGGTCTGNYCYVPGAPPISFAQISPGLYALASGSGDARELLPAHPVALKGVFLGAPIWATGLGPRELPLLASMPGAERLSLWLTPRLPAAIDLRFALETKDTKSATTAARDLGTISKLQGLEKYLSEGEVSAAGRSVSGRVPLKIELLEALVAR